MPQAKGKGEDDHSARPLNPPLKLLGPQQPTYRVVTHLTRGVTLCIPSLYPDIPSRFAAWIHLRWADSRQTCVIRARDKTFPGIQKSDVDYFPGRIVSCRIWWCSMLRSRSYTVTRPLKEGASLYTTGSMIQMKKVVKVIWRKAASPPWTNRSIICSRKTFCLNGSGGGKGAGDMRRGRHCAGGGISMG